jgi:hypothetical protein
MRDISRYVVTALVASGLTVGAVLGVQSAHPRPAPVIVRTQDQVASFNDGFSTCLYGDGR